MPKRRAVADSDDEDNHSLNIPASSSKRARTADSDQESGAHDELEVQDDADDKPFAEDVDEEEFEQANTERIRARMEEKRLKISNGSVAEYGIIETIEMHQFMCHKFLTFSFGPQINFIIGHNGSGKSAVLSAITVALGGKANSTGRGNGLKSFIREGQSVSEVTISLKNQGEEAFKPNEYGKSIYITRRFTREGSSTWKIRSKDGKVISTKKDELAAICDHMNIQVDNPMTVLTQDAARQFLSASHPQDKYKFFLRGTQLSQLSDEYDTCLENITQTAKVLAQKREAIPDLRTSFREATVRYEEAAKAREQKKKADDLKKELAWAHVKAKEDEMTEKLQEVEKAQKRVPKTERNLEEAVAAVEAATAKVGQYEAEIRSLGDIDDLNKEKTSLNGQMRAHKEKISAYNADLKSMDDSLKATNRQIEDLQKHIDAEAARMATHTQAKREETQRKLDEARNEVSAAESALHAILQQKQQYVSQCDSAKRDGMEAEKKVNEIKSKIQENEAMIQRCRQQEKDALVPYGKNIKGVLEAINTMRWAGERPLGPLGVHVKAKDPSKWGDLLRAQLGSYLTAFAITDARDRNQLKKLLSDSGNGRTLIIIYEKDLFEYKHAEPPEHMLTVLRALEISDPYVLRIMINQARIERQLLTETREEAQRQLESLRGGGSAWALNGHQVRVFPEGGLSSNPLHFAPRNDATSLLLTGRDTASEVQHYTDEIRRIEGDFQFASQQVSQLKAQFNEGRRGMDRLKGEEQRANEALRAAKYKLNNLQQEANDDMPAGISGLEDAKKEAEEEKENIKRQFEDVMRQKNEIGVIQTALMNQMKDLKTKIDEFEERRRAIQRNLEDAAAKRTETQMKVKGWEKKLEEERMKVAVVEEAANVLKLEFTQWTAKAQDYCEQVMNPRKVEVLQRNLESVQKALKEREKKHGASVDDMASEVAKAKERLEKAEKELKQMSSLNRALKASLITRLSRWQEFRRHIALRCKLVFQFHLSHRGYFGKVLFNHDTGSLQLKVQTDDQIATQGSRDKDPRSLSGGEKSFSTICLLLSLWESIGCPLRCLDEFDVFMDAVNRRISMKMMIDTANSSDKKQYVLITPQDMTNVTLGPSVRVHRMTDPERGNGVLAFSG